MEKNIQIDFFMGANTPDGFCTFYDELKVPKDNWRSFLIKGGAGTGKSGVMKKVVSCFGEKEEMMELIHCSSDPNSLDGVILHNAKISMVDATPPHVIEPQYPGGYETVINLCEYFKEEILNERLKSTVKYQTLNNECHKRCQGYLKSAKGLLSDNNAYVSSCTNFEKIEKLVQKIKKDEFKKKNTRQPVIYKRLLSAVTNQGIITYHKTATSLANKIYIIQDEYGVSSNTLLMGLCDIALGYGYDVFACYCPLSFGKKIEHLFVPELDLGFCTQTRYNDFSFVAPYKVINYTRFTDMEKMKERKNYLRFNKKVAYEVIKEAVLTLRNAKVIHDKLEETYSGGVDFSMVNDKTENIIEKIRLRYE